MYDIQELQHKWLVYKLKSFLPMLSIGAIIVVIVVVMIPAKEQTKIKAKTKHVKQHLIKQEKPKPTLNPSYEFIKNIQSIKPKKTIQPLKVKRTHITIKKQIDKNSTQVILSKFNKSKDPWLSLLLAKKYYEDKQYKKSYKYAYITNEIDNTIEDSWIVFIKSLIKLDKKNKAINTLDTYIRYTNSKKAKQLKKEILSGKLP